MSRLPSRRVVLTTGVWGAAALLAGCQSDTGGGTDAGPTGHGQIDAAPTGGGVDPAPPTVPDLALLRSTLQRTRDLIARGAPLAMSPRGESVARELPLLEAQERVLADLLQAAGVEPGPPATSLDGRSPGGTSATSAPPRDDAASASQPGPGRDGLTEWVRLLGEDATARTLGPLAGASPVNLPLLVSLHGQRAAAAAALGQRLRWPSGTAPTGPSLVPLLTALRPAVYAVEVVVARSSGAQRERTSALLTGLQSLATEVTALAGEAGGPPPLGYGLPTPVDTPAGRQRLVLAVLAPLPAATLTGVESLTGDTGAIVWSVRTLTRILGWGAPFDQAVTAFPGMTT